MDVKKSMSINQIPSLNGCERQYDVALYVPAVTREMNELGHWSAQLDCIEIALPRLDYLLVPFL